MSWPLSIDEIGEIKEMGFFSQKLNLREVKQLGSIIKKEYELKSNGSIFLLTIYKDDEDINVVLIPEEGEDVTLKYKGYYEKKLLSAMIILNS